MRGILLLLLLLHQELATTNNNNYSIKFQLVIHLPNDAKSVLKMHSNVKGLLNGMGGAMALQIKYSREMAAKK
jgi:hypothetical protein